MTLTPVQTAARSRALDIIADARNIHQEDDGTWTVTTRQHIGHAMWSRRKTIASGLTKAEANEMAAAMDDADIEELSRL